MSRRNTQQIRYLTPGLKCLSASQIKVVSRHVPSDLSTGVCRALPSFSDFIRFQLARVHQERGRPRDGCDGESSNPPETIRSKPQIRWTHFRLLIPECFWHPIPEHTQQGSPARLRIRIHSARPSRRLALTSIQSPITLRRRRRRFACRWPPAGRQTPILKERTQLISSVIPLA